LLHFAAARAACLTPRSHRRPSCRPSGMDALFSVALCGLRCPVQVVQRPALGVPVAGLPEDRRRVLVRADSVPSGLTRIASTRWASQMLHMLTHSPRRLSNLSPGSGQIRVWPTVDVGWRPALAVSRRNYRFSQSARFSIDPPARTWRSQASTKAASSSLAFSPRSITDTP
jgi:hypothetical protein